MGPRLLVVSRLIGQSLERGDVVEAPQSGLIVIVDEGISFIVGVEFVFTAVAAGGRRVLNGLGDAGG